MVYKYNTILQNIINKKNKFVSKTNIKWVYVERKQKDQKATPSIIYVIFYLKIKKINYI